MRTYGVDVASFQPGDLTRYKQLGASFAIIKVSQGTNYKNPLAVSQIASRKAHRMLTMGYFYAEFSSNSTLASYNADYAISTAKQFGLPLGSYLAVDWEDGSGNSIHGNTYANTQACLVAMNRIKQAGYKPLLYASSSVMENNLNIKNITKKYPNSLWIAAYPLGNGVPSNQPNFNYYPSLDGVAIWQFTDNWCGASVDGNVAVLDLNNDIAKEDDEMSWHPEVKINELGRFKINKDGGCNLYDSDKLNKVIGEKKTGEFKIFRAKNGAVQAGTNQWFSQADGITKINPLAVNANTRAICRVINDRVFTQNERKASKGIMSAPKNQTYKVNGRIGKYLLVGNENTGKYLDGNKCMIVL